jgi:hypothetical protein
MLEECVSTEDHERFVLCILSRFQVFIHLYRGGQLSSDENELFDLLDDRAVSDQAPPSSF